MSYTSPVESAVSAAAAAIKGVFPRHCTVKELARLMGLPVGTAHEWINRHFSNARRRALALALLAELDRQDSERALIRRQLEEWAGDGMDGFGSGRRNHALAPADDRAGRLARRLAKKAAE